MSNDSSMRIINDLSDEIITSDELNVLLRSKRELIAYDGFEPSGKMHVAQALMKSALVNAFGDMGVKYKMLIADWHARANKKFDGDLEKIQTVGHYFIEVWKSCGMNTENVEFVWASDQVKDVAYWDLVMRIAGMNNLKRILRCAQIMGRSDTETLTAAQVFYPCMQAADIFYLKANICQLGTDQRKVNMLAREIAPDLGYEKPVAVHHHMVMGLLTPEVTNEDNALERSIKLKMSKSVPGSAIFVTDSEEEVRVKIRKAYCPEGVKENNPILEYCRYILFPVLGKIEIKRPEKFGGDVAFVSYEDLKKAFTEKQLHPLDLKDTVAESLNKLLEPIRLHFEQDDAARILKGKVESFIVTR